MLLVGASGESFHSLTRASPARKTPLLLYLRTFLPIYTAWLANTDSVVPTGSGMSVCAMTAHLEVWLRPNTTRGKTVGE